MERLYGLEVEPARVEWAVRALAEGDSLRATARMVLTDKGGQCPTLLLCHRPAG